MSHWRQRDVPSTPQKKNAETKRERTSERRQYKKTLAHQSGKKVENCALVFTKKIIDDSTKKRKNIMITAGGNITRGILTNITTRHGSGFRQLESNMSVC